MAKAVAIVSALCFLALASFAHCKLEKFDVEGVVYCDPCRVEFETRLSRGIEGATVRLECRNPVTENVTFVTEATTDHLGHYDMKVEGDHGDEICEISAPKSKTNDCNIPFESFEKARIVLTEESGIFGATRYANPLGFMTAEISDACNEALIELGFST